MLLREQRGRHEHRGLLAVLHRLEHGADGDLGLAEADVAAHEPVHRHRAFHVGLHVDDRLQLVGRLLVRERVLELALPRRVGRERVARRVQPLLVQHDELLRDLRDLGAHTRLRLRPLAAVEPAQRRLVAAGVVPDRVDLVGRDVELVVAAVLEQEVVALDARDGALDHAPEPGDAVLVVHDEVAGLEVVEEPLGVGAPAGPHRPVRAPPAGEVGLGEHRELDGREDEPALERRDHDVELQAVLVEQAVDARLFEPSPSALTTMR